MRYAELEPGDCLVAAELASVWLLLGAVDACRLRWLNLLSGEVTTSGSLGVERRDWVTGYDVVRAGRVILTSTRHEY